MYRFDRDQVREVATTENVRRNGHADGRGA
jgi:hypothetical protein